MSQQDDSTRDSLQPYAERWTAESVFLIDEATEEQAPFVHQWYEAHTPFMEGRELEETYGPEAEEDHFAKLEDEESDEALYEPPYEASELGELDVQEFAEEEQEAIVNFATSELLIGHELTHEEREHLLQQILDVAGLRNLQNLYGLDSAQQVRAHLQAIFAGRNTKTLEEIRREVLDAKHLRGRERGKELLRYLKQIAVLDLNQRIKADAKSSVDISTLTNLQLDELGRLYRLIREDEKAEIARRVKTYKRAQEAMRRASRVTEQTLRQERKKVADERRIGRPADDMRAVGHLYFYRNSELLVHAFGAADAYGVDPYLLLGIFFQEGGRSALHKRTIHSFDDYGLDNAFALRHERNRRKELQLGTLIEAPKKLNERDNEVVPALITGVRDVLYYTAVQARIFQDRVIKDFSRAGLETPVGDTLSVWLLIYWNGGQGNPANTIEKCRELRRRRKPDGRSLNVGGWCRLLFSKARGDIKTVLEKNTPTSGPPNWYSYANRVMGSIETLRRLGIADGMARRGEERFVESLDELYIEESDKFDIALYDETYGAEELDGHQFEDEPPGNELSEDLYNAELEDEIDEEATAIGTAVGETEELEIESEVLGTNDMDWVRNALDTPYRWICRLDIQYEITPWKGSPTLKGSGRGTGTLIGTRHVVTAAHNIRGYDPRDKNYLQATSIKVTSAHDGSTTPSIAATEVDLSNSYVHPRWKIPLRVSAGGTSNPTGEVETNKYDYALLTLKTPIGGSHVKALGGQLGYWGDRGSGGIAQFRRLDPKILRSNAVFVAGYGDDACVKAVRKAISNPSIPFGSQLWATGRLRLLWENGIEKGVKVIYVSRSMAHDVDTCRSQSGGPVWIERNGVFDIVGVHTGAANLTDGSRMNHAVRVTQEFLDQIRAWLSKK